MFTTIERSPSMQQHSLKQSTLISGSTTRKRSWGQTNKEKNLLLSTPVLQKKGRKSLGQSLTSFEQQMSEICSPTKFDLSGESDYLLLSPEPLDFDKENLNDSDVSNYHQTEAEALKAAELPARIIEIQFKRIKKGYATKFESMRRAKIEVKEELRDICEEAAGLQHQVGLHEGKTEFLTRENEKLKRDLTKALDNLNTIQQSIMEKESGVRIKEQTSRPKQPKIQKSRKFSCEFCAKTFFKRIRLNIHMRIHTGERPFKCDMCELSFTTADILRNHCRTHGEKGYKCKYCGKAFSRNDGLQYHLRALHNTGEGRLKCPHCPRDFVRKDRLKRHINIKHKRKTHREKSRRPRMQCVKELRALSSSIKRHISAPIVSALPETIPIAEICILESSNREEEVEVLNIRQNGIEPLDPVTSSAIRPLQSQLLKNKSKQLVCSQSKSKSKSAREEETLRSVPIKSVALNCEFAVSNSSSTASTITIMANTISNEKCSATFNAPSTTVNASVFAKLRCQHDAHASVQNVIRQSEILLCSSDVLISSNSTDKYQIIDYIRPLEKMTTKMGLFCTRIVNKQANEQQKDIITIAIHAEEEACRTGSQLLLVQKKAGNNYLTITEYRSGKAVPETKEHWNIPLAVYKRRRHILGYIRSRCEYFFALKRMFREHQRSTRRKLMSEQELGKC